jgi:hypothetical protein
VSQAKSDDEKQLYQTKYATLMNTWFTNSLELDKSLLTISAGGIGLSFTMMQIFKTSVVFNFMVSVSILFSLTIFSILAIFNFNNKRIKQEIEYQMQSIINGEANERPESAITESILNFLDTARNTTFLIGVIIFLTSFFFTNPQEENQKDTESTKIKVEKSANIASQPISQETIHNSNNVNISIKNENTKAEHIPKIIKKSIPVCPPKKTVTSETANNITIKCCDGICNTTAN